MKVVFLVHTGNQTSAATAVQVVALVTEGAQRPELPAPKDLPGTGTFAGYSEYIMLMEQCWDQDPAARPTFAQVGTLSCNCCAWGLLLLLLLLLLGAMCPWLNMLLLC